MRRPTHLSVERYEDRTNPTSPPVVEAVDVSALTFTDAVSSDAPTVPPPAPTPISTPAGTSPAARPPVAADLVPRFVFDPTFGTNGRAFVTPTLVPGSLYGSAQDVALTADGKIVVLGQINGGTVVARFNPNGTLDTTFDGDGVLSLGSWSESVSSVYMNRLILLPDGKMLLGGTLNRTEPMFTGQAQLSIYPPYPTTNPEFVVVRLTTGGAFDPTFGDAGRAVVGFDDGSVSGDSFTNMGVTADGAIVLGGSVSPYFAVPALADGTVPVYASTPAFGVAKLTADGRLDTAFDGDGKLKIDQTAERDFVFSAMSVLADGRVVLAAGNYPSWNGLPPAPEATLAVARLTADGRFDPAFDGDGVAAVAVPPNGTGGVPYLGSLSVGGQPDGGVVAGGFGYGVAGGTTQGLFAVRFTAGGQLDTGFGTTGRLVVPLADYAYSGRLTVADDGRLYVTVPVPLVHTFNPAAGGDVALIPPAPIATATLLYRYTPAGQPDTAFGPDGRVVLPNGPAGQGVIGSVVTTDSAGRLVVAGNTDTSPVTGTRIVVARLTAGEVPRTQPIVVSGPAGKAFSYVPGSDGKYVAGESLDFFRDFTGPTRVVRADVNGDGAADTIAGVGPGGGSRVGVMYGVPAGGRLPALSVAPFVFTAFEESFTGGVFVAAADLDADGRAEIVVTPDVGGSGRVRVFSLANGVLTEEANFFAIEDANFRGGATAALGDVNGDGRPDLVVGAGVGGGPRVATFDGTDLAAGRPRKLFGDYFAFDDANFRGGIFAAAGDADGDGRAEVVFSAGTGGGPRVAMWSGGRRVLDFLAGADARGGARVALSDADGDGRADLLVGSGAGVPSRVRTYVAVPTGGSATEPPLFQEFDPFGTTPDDGVFVG